jgi:phage shock protein PspC (stress-responsive transcriptional regulator)
MPSRPPLRRSRSDRILGGVCGGLARRYGWSPTLVRVLFVIGSFLPILPGFLVYLVLWIAIPKAR